MIKRILAKLKINRKFFDEEKIRKAVNLIKGKKAEPLYGNKAILETLDNLLPLKPDDETIIATLLHEFYINGLVDEDKIKELFGEEVLEILFGIKKLDALNYIENDRAIQIENLRKMILVLAKDIRVILVVLASRLYKMRNLKKLMNESERKIYSAETLDLYVPLCARLGIYTFKSDLEDLAFMYSNPTEYKNILLQVEQLRERCDVSIDYIKNELERFLRSKHIEAEVFGRIKNIYSIYRKLKMKGFTSVSDLYDIFAMRMILPAKIDDKGNEIVDHLYSVLGLIHSEWKPLSKRFRDYLAVPKPNGYRSLHTVVLGLAPNDMDQPVEIQIRDSLMHRDAEYGIASHWIYKESGGTVNNLQPQMEFIKGLVEIRNEFDLDYDVLKEVEINIFSDRVFVLTPRGEVKDLPLGSCPIDFAYCVHTDIGNKCVMAKANGSLVPLDYELKNNDVVEIITKKDATPKLRWLSIVKTAAAKNRIKAWFSLMNRESNIKEGKKLINEQLDRLSKPHLDQNYSMFKDYIGEKLTFSQRESLVEEVGHGAKLANDVVKKIYPYRDNVADKVIKFKQEKLSKTQQFIDENKKYVFEEHILVGGEDGLPLKIAACCTPKMGDGIIGYVTRGNRITIHKISCRLLDSLDPVRFIFADWKRSEEDGKEKYLIWIKIKAACRNGLINDVTSVIADLGFNIRDILIKNPNNGFFEQYFLIELKDLEKLDVLLDKLENIQGVVKATKDKSFKPTNL